MIPPLTRTTGYLQDGRPIKTGTHIEAFTVSPGRLVLALYGETEVLTVALDAFGAQNIREVLDGFIDNEYDRMDKEVEK